MPSADRLLLMPRRAVSSVLSIDMDMLSVHDFAILHMQNSSGVCRHFCVMGHH